MRKVVAVAAVVSALALGGYAGSASAAGGGCQGLLSGVTLHPDGVGGSVHIACTAPADKASTYKGHVEIRQADGTWKQIDESSQGDTQYGSFQVTLTLRATCVPGTHAYRIFGASGTEDGSGGQAAGGDVTFTC